VDDAEWFAEHDAYLHTDAWKRRRQAALERADFECQAELPGCTGEASQVHHLTYRHWRNEPLFDLVAVCRCCHEQITEMDRAQRPHPSRIGPREETVFSEIDDSMGVRLRRMLNEGTLT